MLGEWCIGGKTDFEQTLRIVNFSGYKERTSKEGIVIDKKTAHFLKLISRDIIDVIPEKKDRGAFYKTPASKYILDFDKTTHSTTTVHYSKNKTIVPWEFTQGLPNLRIDQKSILKEVLNVTGKAKNFIGKQLLIDNYDINCETILKNELHNYKLLEAIAEFEHHQQYGYNVPRMASILEDRQFDVLEETVCSTCELDDFLVKPVEINLFKVYKLASDYKLDHITVERRDNEDKCKKKVFNPPEWKLQRDFEFRSLKRIQLHCQEENFHPWEVYKLDFAPTMFCSRKKRQTQNFVSKPRWKMDIAALKTLSWNPFENISMPSNVDLIEQVVPEKVNISSNIMEFQKIQYSKMDLFMDQDVWITRNDSVKNVAMKELTVENVEHFEDKECPSESLMQSENIDDLSNRRILTAGKRSLLDDDLLNLVAVKRTKMGIIPRSSTDTAESYTEDELELNSNVDVEFESGISKIDTSSSLLIFNGKFVERNYMLINTLNKKQCTILEIDMNDTSDALVGPATCIVIRDIGVVFQKKNHRVVFMDELFALKLKYKRVVVFLTYSESLIGFDQDLPFKTQLLLSCCDMTSHLVPQNQYHLLADWLLDYVADDNPNSRQLENMNAERQILSYFGINPFAIEKILQKSTLEQFLLFSHGKRVLLFSQFLTDAQLELIDDFASLGW